VLKLYQPKQVVAFERRETYVFNSIAEAAVAYNVNKKIILDRIDDGCTLKDGYTTLDWYSGESDTLSEFREMRRYIPEVPTGLYSTNASGC